MDALVSGDWLAAHLGSVRVADVRWYLHRPGGGRAAYDEAHLPGAVHLDVDSDLSDPAGPGTGRHPLPSPERFAATLGRVGIAAGTPVVAYDDAGGSIAARLWWLLHVLDEPVAVLDGGLAAWPGELTRETPDIAPVRRSPVAWPEHRFRGPDQFGTAQLLDAHPGPVRARRSRHRSAARPHPGSTKRTLAGQPRPGRAVPAGTRAARHVRQRCVRRLLRVGGDRVPRPARAAHFRRGRHRALPRVVVALGCRPVPSQRGRRGYVTGSVTGSVTGT